MTRVVFVTGHYWDSKRRAGFHWLADACLRENCDVLFLTTSLSLLSIPRLDHRLRYGVWRELNQLLQKQPHLWSYVAFTHLHPANVRIGALNRLLTPIFMRYGEQVNLAPCESWIQQADLFVFECTAGLMLMERIKRLNSSARCVYRVSDDLRFMRSHSVLLAAEERYLQSFDIISTPSPGIYDIFAGKTDRRRLEFHAIRKDLFARQSESPYEGKGPHVIFVGIAYFDYTFLDVASRLLPDWQFHIIGPIRKLPRRPNIIAYGEMPFVDTIPYIKHADIGLQTLAYRPGGEAFTHSLKTIQYTYCQLPIVAPTYLQPHEDHWCHYTPGDEKSIVSALKRAADYDRNSISTASVLSWDEITMRWCSP